MEQNSGGKGFAIASLVLGLVGLIVALFVQPVVGLILGIVGIVMSSVAKKAGFTGGMSTAGLVLSILAVVIGALLLIAVIACYGAIGGILNSLS